MKRDRAQWQETRIGNYNAKYITRKLFRPFARKTFTRMRYIAHVFNSVGVTLAGCILHFNIIIGHEQCAECFALHDHPRVAFCEFIKFAPIPISDARTMFSGVALSAALARNVRLIATYNFFFGTSGEERRHYFRYDPRTAGRDREIHIVVSYCVYVEFPSWESDITGRGTLLNQGFSKAQDYIGEIVLSFLIRFYPKNINCAKPRIIRSLT